MQQVSPRLEHWPSVVGHISSLMDLDASARANKALLRKRGVRSAADLLHLALLYGPGGLSLHSVGSFATEAWIADLCDVSLLDRLRNAGDFLAEVLARLLADSRGDANRRAFAIQPGGRLDRFGCRQPGQRLAAARALRTGARPLHRSCDHRSEHRRSALLRRRAPG